MSSKKKLLPHEAWDALEKASLADEAARVAKLNDAELDAELARAGLDPKALRAEGAALAARLGAVPAQSSGTTTHSRSGSEAQDETLEAGAWVSAPPALGTAGPFHRRGLILLAATLVLAGLAGGAVALGLFRERDLPNKDWPDAAPSASASPAPIPPPLPPPDEVRKTPPASEDKRAPRR